MWKEFSCAAFNNVILIGETLTLTLTHFNGYRPTAPSMGAQYKCKAYHLVHGTGLNI